MLADPEVEVSFDEQAACSLFPVPAGVCTIVRYRDQDQEGSEHLGALENTVPFCHDQAMLVLGVDSVHH